MTDSSTSNKETMEPTTTNNNSSNSEQQQQHPVSMHSFHLYEKPDQLTRHRCEKIVRYARKRLREGSGDNESSNNISVEKNCVIPHSRIELGAKLGKGAFSSVYEIKSIKTNNKKREQAKTYTTTPLVVKFLRSRLYDNHGLFAASAADLVKEGNILSTLSHPNVIRWHGCSSAYGVSAYLNGYHDSYFLVLERLERTMSDRIREWKLRHKELYHQRIEEKKDVAEDGYNYSGEQHHLVPVTSGKSHGSSRGVNTFLKKRLSKLRISSSSSHRQQRISSESVTTSPTTSFPEEEGYDDNNTSILGDDSDEYDSSLIMTSKDSKKCKLESLRVQLLEERINVAVQLADALAYLHDQNVLHRDLKPDNIGFDKDGNLKVFDFDIARVAPISMNEDELFHMTQKVGSPRYMSPECAKREPYNKKADVYSYGLLFHQIMTLEKPYDDIDDEDHEECVFYEHARPHMIDVPMPQTVKNMIQTTWSANIRQRPTMKNVQNVMHEQRNELLRFGTTTTPEDSSSLSKKSAITTPSAAYVTSCAFHSMSDNNPKYKKMIKMMMKKSSNYSKRNVALHHNSSRSSGSHRPLFRRFAKAA